MQLFPSQFNGKEKLCSYRDIGTFKMLMPLAKNPVLAGYAGDYLAPLESSTALLSTAKAWVFCGGDYAEAARVLNAIKTRSDTGLLKSRKCGAQYLFEYKRFSALREIGGCNQNIHTDCLNS
ncbi:MAG: hypothetical protein ACLTK0_09070 [Anaerovoracaceae bacterium]